MVALSNSKVQSTFWKNKKVAVTGHTGFKGSWLSLYLHKMGADVFGYSLAAKNQPNMYESCSLDKKIKSHIADIRNFCELEKTLTDFKPEIVFHLAAQSLVLPSYEDPVETYSTNVMGTAHVLEVARKSSSIKVLINVTSDKCYEDTGENAYKETDRLGGHDPYSNSKACAELISSSYRKSFFNKSGPVALSTVRAGNIIGGGDWSDYRLIPDCIKSLHDKKPIVIRQPKAVRPWQHVLEPVTGYLMLAEQMWTEPKKFSEAWNFGPNEESCKSVEQLVPLLIKQWGSGSMTVEPSAQHETQVLKLDSTKAKTRLQWKPRLGLEQTIENLTNWYQQFYKNEDMYQTTLKQIEDYERLF